MPLKAQSLFDAVRPAAKRGDGKAADITHRDLSRQLFWLCIIPLVAGVWLYGVARATVPQPLHEFMALVGFDDTQNVRLLDWFDRNWLAIVIRDSLPHGLWAFALGAFVVLSTLGMGSQMRQGYMWLVYALIVVLEVSVGVFDVIDLALATALYWTAIWLTSKKLHSYRRVNSHAGLSLSTRELSL